MRGILQDVLTTELDALIPRSNLPLWKHEPNDKYILCEINVIVKEVELIKRINQS